MFGERIAFGALARKFAYRRRLGDSLFGRQFIFSGICFQLFERQRQLVNQARRAFRSLAVDLALQLGNLQLLLGNQRSIFRRLRSGNRKLRCDI
jgi:hypothetical protein